MADTKIFQARGVLVSTDISIHKQVLEERLTKGQLVEKMFAFYMTQGGPKWQKPRSMDRPPTERRVGRNQGSSETLRESQDV